MEKPHNARSASTGRPRIWVPQKTGPAKPEMTNAAVNSLTLLK